MNVSAYARHYITICNQFVITSYHARRQRPCLHLNTQRARIAVVTSCHAKHDSCLHIGFGRRNEKGFGLKKATL